MLDVRMKPTQRSRRITELLNSEYPDREPLLVYQSPFELVIGVILSAQTTDAQVNQVTPKLFSRYPDASSLAQAAASEVEQIIHSTGFYRNKARNVIGAAARILEAFDGEVPESMEDLVTIPGMGRKSANVIRGVIYGHPSIVVDTHLTRVANRIGFVEGKNAVKIERELREIVPEELQTDFSMAVNLHGRAICTARKPDCSHCVIREFCDYGQRAAASEAGG
jgi:endonuclease-3